MSFYERLQRETVKERNYLLSSPIIGRCLTGDIDLADYIRFLSQAYHHVKHTVPLLMATGARLPMEKEWLRVAVAEYIEEEIGHQEWILNDIAACGSDKEAVRNSRPEPGTELMVAYAYDTVQRVNPVGFFGMVYVLEGTSVAIATQAAKIIQQQLSLPKNAFSYLISHGSVDQKHIGDYEKIVNRLDCDEDRQAIIHAARVFFRLYGDILRHLPRAEAESQDNAIRSVA